MSQQLTAGEVKELAKRAAPEKWRSVPWHICEGAAQVRASDPDDTDYLLCEVPSDGIAAFIAAAPAMAHLIETQAAELAALRTERDALRKHLVRAVDYFHDTAAISEYHPTPEWVQDWNSYVKCEGCTADILVGHEDQHLCEL